MNVIDKIVGKCKECDSDIKLTVTDTQIMRGVSLFCLGYK